MIKVSVMYPNGSGHHFDIDYYTGKHMPMVRQKLGATLKRMEVEQGLAGGQPGTPPTYLAAGHLYCDSVEAFQSAFEPHAAEIMADIPNYTNTQPVLQISEVKL
jgi:uncharacterized protein (TIGR02118 family)